MSGRPALDSAGRECAAADREREVVRYVSLGLRNGEVAKRLRITEGTVKTHMNNIFHKLAIRDRVELALYALRLGLITVHEQVR